MNDNVESKFGSKLRELGFQPTGPRAADGLFSTFPGFFHFEGGIAEAITFVIDERRIVWCNLEIIDLKSIGLPELK